MPCESFLFMYRYFTRCESQCIDRHAKLVNVNTVSLVKIANMNFIYRF